MISRKNICVLVASLIFATACTSISQIKDSLTSKFNKTPQSIQEAISTRVNQEKQIFALGQATLKKSGAIVAQSNANKKASEVLRREIKREVDGVFNGYLAEMDSFSKSVIKPVTADLNEFATGLIMKKVTQKGAWQDAEDVYSLLVVDRTEINNIATNVLKNFVANAAKNLQSAGGAFQNNQYFDSKNSFSTEDNK